MTPSRGEGGEGLEWTANSYVRDLASAEDAEALHSSPDHIDIGGDETVRLGDHTLTVGQINALADYVASMDELIALSPKVMAEALDLIGRHDHHHGGLSEEELARLYEIFPKYQELSKNNDAHFAPPADGVSPTGKPNHVSEMKRHLTAAYEELTSGGADALPDVGLAKAHAAFGSHYVADAFSAGHLFNKEEVMGRTEAGLDAHGIGEVFPLASRMLAEIASAELAGWAIDPLVGSPRDVRADDLADMYWYVKKLQPDMIQNAFVRSLHDRIGATGVEVSGMGATWRMGGDEHLDETSLGLANKLIGQVLDLLTTLSVDPTAITLGGLLSFVEDSLPAPTASGQAFIDGHLDAAFESPEAMALTLAEATKSELDTVLQSISDSPLGNRFRLVRRDVEEAPDQAPTPGEDVAPEPEIYVVVAGDTLFEIAEAWLGDGWLYPNLHEANLAEIGPDPDRIEPGMRLLKPVLAYPGGH